MLKRGGWSCVLVQFDIHSPAATVREALMYSAQLRLIGADKKQLISFVDEVPPLLVSCHFQVHASAKLQARAESAIDWQGSKLVDC